MTHNQTQPFIVKDLIMITCYMNRIYELFNLYFSKKYQQTFEVIVLTSVIVFKTFQISMKMCFMFSILIILDF